MKKLFLIILFIITFPLSGFAQYFHYIIKIKFITSCAHAKEITDILREDFKSFPHFSQEKGVFDFISKENVLEEKIKSDLKSYNLELIYFKIEEEKSIRIQE